MKNQNFPKIESGQVVLIISENTTGIVLNRAFQYAKEEDSIYYIFDHINEAQYFFSKNQPSNTYFQFLDKDRKVILEKYCAAHPQAPLESKKQWWKIWK